MSRSCRIGDRVPSRRGKSSDLWAQAVQYASLSLVIPGSAIAGYFCGDWLDGLLHTGEVLSVIGAVGGAVAGIVEVLRLITRWEKRGGNVQNGGEPD